MVAKYLVDLKMEHATQRQFDINFFGRDFEVLFTCFYIVLCHQWLVTTLKKLMAQANVKNKWKVPEIFQNLFIFPLHFYKLQQHNLQLKNRK